MPKRRRPAPRRSPTPRGRVHAWKGLRVVVTAGPTREHLDDIRFLTNASTGLMGIELAHVARKKGAHVVLVLGPTHLDPPAGVEVQRVVSTADMLRATTLAAAGAHCLFFAAAPADFRPRRRRRGKPPREGPNQQHEFVATPDIAARLGRKKGDRVHVGFALEVEGGEPRARAKLARKNFDAIVLNGPANLGEGGGEIAWIAGDEAPTPLRASSKRALAREIVKRTGELLARR